MDDKQKLFQDNFSDIYKRTYRYVAMRVWRTEEVEDVTSETLIAAWRSISRYDSVTAELMTWIISIARHKITDSWRKHQAVPWDDNFLATVPDERNVSSATDIDSQTAVQNILQSLPKDFQVLLTLRYLDELSHEEIATVLHKSPEAVRQALSRLQRKLRTQFPQYANEF